MCYNFYLLFWYCLNSCYKQSFMVEVEGTFLFIQETWRFLSCLHRVENNSGGDEVGHGAGCRNLGRSRRGTARIRKVALPSQPPAFERQGRSTHLPSPRAKRSPDAKWSWVKYLGRFREHLRPSPLLLSPSASYYLFSPLLSTPPPSSPLLLKKSFL